MYVDLKEDSRDGEVVVAVNPIDALAKYTSVGRKFLTLKPKWKIVAVNPEADEKVITVKTEILARWRVFGGRIPYRMQTLHRRDI